jgi:hypothetical protein
MNLPLKRILWHQFGGSIDVLENALVACPGALWDIDSKFWHIGYQTLFYLDYYLTEIPEQFSPPPPFTLSEFDPKGRMPGRTYSKDELLTYLSFCRQKCHG